MKIAIAILLILRHWKIMKNFTVWIRQLSTNVISVTTDSSLKVSYNNMLSKHINEEKYKYDKCGQKYKRKNKMKRHILLWIG